MKYYLTTIKSDSQAIFKYEDIETAMTNFHNEMSYAYNAKIKTTCYITNELGVYIKKPETYDHAMVDEAAD